MRSPVRQFGGTLVTNVSIASITLLTGIISPRLLGPVGEGELTAIQAWPLLVGTLAMLGMESAVVYYVARQPGKSREFTATAFLVGLVSSLVMGGIAWVVLPFVLSAQTAQVVSAAQTYLLIGVIFAVIGIPHGALRGVGSFAAWNIYRIVPNIVLLCVLLGAWLSGHPSAVSISHWLLAGLLVSGLPVFLVAVPRLQGRAVPDIRLMGRLLRYGLPSALASLPQTVNLRLDQLLIIALLPSRWLGLYVVAASWGGVSGPVLSAVAAVLLPHVAAEGDPRRKGRLLAVALQGGGVVVVGISVLLVLCTPAGLPLVFGGRYGPAVPAALVLVPAGAILAWSGIAEDGLRGVGQPGRVLAAEMAGAVMTVVTLPPLLGAFGILGAALASLLGYSATALAAFAGLKYATGYGVRLLLVPARQDVRAVSSRLMSSLSGQAHPRWRRERGMS